MKLNKLQYAGALLPITFAMQNSAVAEEEKAEGSTKPNILFILTDDQTYNGINALNNKEIHTPNMDTLVNQGTSFTNAHIFGASSAAVCAPSRAMLMTGRNNLQLPKSICIAWAGPKETRGDCPYITFPEVFRKAGYETFATGKQHNGTKIFHRGFTTGGKLFFHGMHNLKRTGGHATPVVCDFDPTGKYEKSKEYKENKFSTELFTDASIKFLEEYDGKKPFMMYVAYTAPHDPRMAPKKFVDMYPPEKISLPDNFLSEHPFDNGCLKIRDENLAPFPRTPERVKKEIGGYYAMISHLDEQIGRIFSVLKKRGMNKNTIIVLAGDNGLAVGQHGLMGKQNLYEHSIGVPLIFKGPGIPHDKKISQLCYLYDVFPTLCGLCHFKIPESVTGKNLQPLIDGSSTQPPYKSHFYAFLKKQRAVREGDWKLIRYNIKGKQTTQLFNLKNDPLEKNNLAGNPEYSARIKELNALMVESGKEAGDKEEWYYKL